MISAIKTAIKFFNEQGIHSLNNIPPLRALIKNQKSSKNIFFFTMDDVWEKTNLSDLKRLASILDKHRVKGTFFVTPYYNNIELSEKKAEQIRKMLEGHEFAQHGLCHTKEDMSLNAKELRSGKNFLEKRLKTKIYGYRAPKFLRNRYLLNELASLGFLYNSDQFLLRPYPFVKDKITVIPCHDKCDPFALNWNEKATLSLVKSKIKYSVKSGKPYVFLMHAYDINQNNLNILDKILKEAKRNGLKVDMSLADFAKFFIKSKGER